jgi:hypothetical protein
VADYKHGLSWPPRSRAPKEAFEAFEFPMRPDSS